ncbi:Hypothetical predicted protein [Marmota monax]|uniref:Uncharacterized protein n=1 Tax=Marmota monax TaxID=9995 RepID=A0A5E4ADF3_MARMO|nr:hypothetical protein GHT09_014404 [Marmota monax]VTJ55145.1 Hypothetical predicted protein [Marmota monax]
MHSLLQLERSLVSVSLGDSLTGCWTLPWALKLFPLRCLGSCHILRHFPSLSTAQQGQVCQVSELSRRLLRTQGGLLTLCRCPTADPAPSLCLHEGLQAQLPGVSDLFCFRIKMRFLMI